MKQLEKVTANLGWIQSLSKFEVRNAILWTITLSDSFAIYALNLMSSMTCLKLSLPRAILSTAYSLDIRTGWPMKQISFEYSKSGNFSLMSKVMALKTFANSDLTIHAPVLGCFIRTETIDAVSSASLK